MNLGPLKLDDRAIPLGSKERRFADNPEELRIQLELTVVTLQGYEWLAGVQRHPLALV